MEKAQEEATVDEERERKKGRESGRAYGGREVLEVDEQRLEHEVRVARADGRVVHHELEVVEHDAAERRLVRVVEHLLDREALGGLAEAHHIRRTHELRERKLALLRDPRRQRRLSCTRAHHTIYILLEHFDIIRVCNKTISVH